MATAGEGDRAVPVGVGGADEGLGEMEILHRQQPENLHGLFRFVAQTDAADSRDEPAPVLQEDIEE
jgi:hypothetical protein